LSEEQQVLGGIAKRIIDGSVSIDDVEEFENLIKIFPDDPGVYRAFADLLAQKKYHEAAANAYDRASRLFIELGMMLQAIVAKILQWRIVQPSQKEARAFHAALVSGNFQESLLQTFIIRMAYPEMIAFMANLVRLRFPTGSIVKRFGDKESAMYLVVSGALKETTYESLPGGKRGGEQDSADLVENDFFGRVYPFEDDVPSSSQVETITRVELVKISRRRLRTICKKYAHIESLVNGLYGRRRESFEDKTSIRVRKTTRHQLPTKVRAKIFPEETDKSPLVVDGITEDISLGGACLVLGARYKTGISEAFVGKNVKIEMDLPEVNTSLNVLGTIVWSKEVSQSGETGTAVGIQFKEMSDQDRAVLDQHCFGGAGEQSLIWSLWESYVKH
jgi:CRP-like cAMP-binding protein